MPRLGTVREELSREVPREQGVNAVVEPLDEAADPSGNDGPDCRALGGDFFSGRKRRNGGLS